MLEGERTQKVAPRALASEDMLLLNMDAVCQDMLAGLHPSEGV